LRRHGSAPEKGVGLGELLQAFRSVRVKSTLATGPIARPGSFGEGKVDTWRQEVHASLE
jgi:hypothetical protein